MKRIITHDNQINVEFKRRKGQTQRKNIEIKLGQIKPNNNSGMSMLRRSMRDPSLKAPFLVLLGFVACCASNIEAANVGS